MQWNVKNIKTLHVEPSSNCNLSCPQCARNVLGEYLNPDLMVSELSIKWFTHLLPKKFIQQLDKVYFCGAFGDPCMHKKLLDIIAFLKHTNPTIIIGINTNGSIRNTEWWSNCAKLLTNDRDYVMFAIDGLSDTNHIYRRNAQWHKIIENVNAYIETGGNALWEFLVFKHNQHQVDDAKKLADELGFNWFHTKITRRFENKNAPGIEPVEEHVKVNYEKLEISCETLHKNEIYVSSYGWVLPCCHIGEELLDCNVDIKRRRSKLLNALGIKNGNLSLFKLENNSIDKIINQFNNINNTWLMPNYSTGKQPVCAETCGVIKNNIAIQKQWRERIELNAFND